LKEISAGGPPPLATYAYDLNGNRITKTLENGTTASYIYDNASQLTRVIHMKSATNIAQFDYTLNAVGNRTAKNASGAIPNVNESYTYDAIDQVTAVSKPGDAQTFAYDPTGNRTAVTSTGSSPGVGSYTTNALNQYTAAAGDVLLYDTKGNLTTQGLSASYNYDSKNRLLGATKGSNTMAVTYDYRNRPVSRSINGTATYFIYDGWSLIGEYNVSGTLLQKYIHGVNIDEILAKIDSTGTVFYQQDGLGSTVALTNSSGALLESYQYDVFGKVTILDNSALPIASSAFANRFLYTRREWIAEVGLYDYRNRVYSADLGRFIQTDPIRFDAGDVNLYRYVANNAVNLTDPFGLILIGIRGSGPQKPNSPKGSNFHFNKGIEELGGTVFSRDEKNEMIDAIKKAKKECPDEEINEMGIDVDHMILIDPVTVTNWISKNFGGEDALDVPKKC